jgi:hypothetical protein
LNKALDKSFTSQTFVTRRYERKLMFKKIHERAEERIKRFLEESSEPIQARAI